MNHTLPALELSVSRQFIFDQWSHHIHHRPLMLVAYIQSNISLTSSLHLPLGLAKRSKTYSIIEDDVLVLTLTRTGTHSDLFGK